MTGTGSHRGNNSDDWKSAQLSVASTWKVVMSGSHHGNNSDDWKLSWEQ